jgi:Ca-activated chloride channel family protein
MKLALSTWLLALSIAHVASADDAILIMDASRSMLGKVHGQRKVEIARNVVGQLLGEIPPERRLGFVAYGHRHASDCDDIEEVVPVGGERARIKSALDAIEVKGQTPLTAAVRFAADKLGYTKNKATVILVSDGIESCHADPCATGAELEKAGVDLTVHVVGFGVKKSESKALECLAEATGGRYLSANDAKELSRALEQTVAQKTVDGPATLSGPASVVEGQWFEIAFTGPNNESDRIALARVTAKPLEWLKADGPRQARAGKVQLFSAVEPGSYELRYVLANGKIAARAPIEVTAGEASLQAPASVGVGATIDVHWTGPEGANDLLQLSRPEQTANEWVTQVGTHRKNGAGSLIAPSKAGRYELRYTTHGRILARAPIDVHEVSIALTAPAQVAVGADFELTWSGPSSEVAKIVLVHAGGAATEWERWSETVRKGNKTSLRAPAKPGKYELRYVIWNERVLASTPIELTDVAATVHGPASVAAGSRFEVAWTGPNYATDQIRIARPGTPASSTERWIEAAKSDHTIDAPPQPGSYELRYVLAGERILASQPLIVR